MIEDTELYPEQNPGKPLYTKRNGELTEKPWFDGECIICGRGLEIEWGHEHETHMCDDCRANTEPIDDRL